MKAAIITDTHFGVRNDSQTFLNFFDKFYSNVFFPYLIDNNITTIFHLGDIVDRRKFINYVTLREFKRIFVQPCIDNKIKLNVIVGNHDIPYRNTNEVNALNELFGNEYDLIDIFSDVKDVEFDGCDITMLPWINNENYVESMQFIKNTKSQVLFGHLEIRGFEMYRGMKNPHGMEAALFDKFDLVCSGHFHHRDRNGNIYYLGNPYEITWSDYDDPRGFHILDSESLEFEFIQNPYNMFHKIYYDDSKEMEKIDYDKLERTCVKVIVVRKTDFTKFDKIIDNLYNCNLVELKIIEDFSEFEDEAVGEENINLEDTMTLLSEYVDNIETELDKERLQNYLRTLYIEAQNI